jgi:hypothetical protein
MISCNCHTFHCPAYKRLYTISIAKTTRCTSYSNYLFLQDTVHVPDGLSVHHQELKTVHTATGICQAGTASGDEMERQFHLVPVSSICLTYACCCMYSLELLMVDEKTVRNM